MMPTFHAVCLKHLQEFVIFDTFDGYCAKGVDLLY